MIPLLMNEHDLLWAILPDGLEPWFIVRKHIKDETTFRIILEEKNIVPEREPRFQGKKVIKSTLQPMTVDDFPIRGRKGELVLYRRWFQFEGDKTMVQRQLPISANGTKLNTEFAAFLKEHHRA